MIKGVTEMNSRFNEWILVLAVNVTINLRGANSHSNTFIHPNGIHLMLWFGQEASLSNTTHSVEGVPIEL